MIRAADQFQQQRAWLALPVAVAKKYADNRAWDLAALIAYYAFLAIFPLLLILVTVLNLVLHSDSGLRHRVVDSALAHYPVIGPQLDNSISPLKQTGFALAVGVAGLLVGSRGVARVMQNALNSAWEIPLTRRPGFPWSFLRGLAMLIVIGAGLITTSTLSGVASSGGDLLTGIGSAVLVLVLSLGLNIGMFWLGFRLAAVSEISWRRLLPGAVISALAWQVMQTIGGYLVTHQLARSSNLYGTFAIVLGLIGWLYLEALLTVAAMEANAVLAYRLWPRSLRPPRTAADRRAYVLYAEVENRGEDQLIRTT
ncbi:MAG TPA: YihY/virulence factor BrkB family protein [Streptosporangiaceae bacterium]|nr:YihY/virulence factor BrkB family protein [Streptosporangiaceae bacterium]